MMDKKKREQIKKSCHTVPTSGHLGTKKTLARVTERFMWPGVTKEVYAMVGIYTVYSGRLLVVECVYPISWRDPNCLICVYRLRLAMSARGQDQHCFP